MLVEAEEGITSPTGGRINGNGYVIEDANEQDQAELGLGLGFIIKLID